ncbi:MAG: hypothetical protein JW860_05040 [Sedimentisphaerales bacterium]|nr:hypothetical protein [Sedimentisphaerales bacterium]
MKRKIIRACVFAMIVLSTFTFYTLAQNANEADMAERAIREQVSKINEAWRSDKGAEIMHEVLSETFIISMPAPNKPGIWMTLNREQFCAAFARILKENPPKEHVRQTTAITVQGGLAYEAGVSIHVTRTDVKTTDEILNLWRKEGDTWRLFFSAEVKDLHEALQKK